MSNLFQILCTFWLLLVNAETSIDFTDSIYQEFSSAENQTDATLSLDDLTDLAKKIQNRSTTQSVNRHHNCTRLNCTEVCYPLSDEVIPKSNFEKHCPRIIYSLTQECVTTSDIIPPKVEEETKSIKPSKFEVWGYGFLFVTAINLCSLVGIVVLPLMRKSFYNDLLIFLISLAVGSLCTSGVLVLIPEAFHITGHPGYVWKAVTIMGGVYLFFVTERILKIVTEHLSTKNSNRYECEILKSRDEPDTPNGTISQKIDRNVAEDKSDDTEVKLSSPAANYTGSDGSVQINVQAEVDIERTIKVPVNTVAWMIIFGDAFHNFIDGLSIGAAFSESTVLGVSICIAVFCEELPHELGDFAILLNAGMSKKKALLFNFLSACTCYLGLILGITLSEVSYATPWILGLAGGMFIYISLADMMPEMNFSSSKYRNQKLKVFLLQNIGMLLGFGVILLITLYGSLIAV